MKMRTNIALLATLLVLCVGYWYVVHRDVARKKEEREAKRLFSFTPDDVKSITIQREGERPSTGVRGPEGAWSITAPLTVPANSMIWDRIAKNVAELSDQRTIEDSPKDLSLYKLNEPRLRVSAAMKDGTSVEARFGEMDPTQKFRYAQLGDGPVFLVEPGQFFELDRDLTWLRDCQLFNVSDSGITYIEFTPMRANPKAAEGQKPEVQEAVSVIAQKDDNGTWSVIAPQPGTADQAMIEGLASDLRYARGRDYIDSPESLKDYKLDPPMVRVRIRSGKDGAVQTAYFGSFESSPKADAGVYVMQEGRPSVFVVDAHIVMGFPQAGPDAWREKRLITKQGSDIIAVKYQAGPQQFLLVKEEPGGWKLKEPQEDATNEAAVSRFIASMLEMKGSSSFVERKPEFGFDVPSIRIALTYKGVETPVEILVGAVVPNTDRRYVTQDSGVVTTLDKLSVDTLARSPKDFMALGLMSFKKNAAREVSLRLEGAAYEFERGEQAWKVQEPAGKVWDSQDDMQGLMDAVANLSAESVDTAVAPPDLSVFGLDAPLLTVKVKVLEDGGSTPIEIGPVSIGKICPDDAHLRYAMVSGRPQIYRVKQAPVSAVRNALRGVVAP